MTTINTIQDLHRILRENPEWRDELRRTLLTEDLLNLPAAHEAFVAEMREFVAEVREFVAATNRRFDENNRRLDNLDTRMDRMSHDFRNFRGNFAETAAVKDAVGIAMAMSDAKGVPIDETIIEVLSPDKRRALARAYGSDNLAAIPREDRRTFYRSDLIMEVQQEDGETFYIAVEASYTCNGRDTRRALTHADLLTKFTNKTAWPAIAGVRIDRQIQETIDSGQVLWYQLEEENLEPPEHA